MPQENPFNAQTSLTDYFPLPRAILRCDLSGTAILLYAVLLDRGTLSQKSGYTNQAGQVYVIYTIEHLAQTLGKTTRTVSSCLRELQHAGLIRRERCGMNSPSRIFLFLPTGKELPFTQEENFYSHRNLSSTVTGRKFPPNDLRKQPERINYNYQHREDESL